MTKKIDLNKLHKSIYIYMKKKALTYEGDKSLELKQYQKDQLRFSKRNFLLTDLNELMNSIKKSNIVYVGDFHTFDQASKNLERILRKLVKEKRPLSLGLEFIHSSNKDTLDAYLNNHITEQEFLEDIDYKESWRFPWIHYKEYFKLAKKYKLDIIALNTNGGLKKRDEAASLIIHEYLNKNPDNMLLILFGEYHIIPDKLPLQVAIRAGTAIKQTIIHQNIDKVYWKLESTPYSQQQIVKFNDYEYSLQTSPPWIKYESQIYWYENLLDDPDFDLHELLIETGAKSFSSTTAETFLYICNKICSSLEVELSQEELEDFNLYDYSNMDFVLKKISKIQPDNVCNFYLKLIKHGKNFKVPFSNIYYCPNYSINRIAYLAGIHIHHLKTSQNFKEYERNIYNKRVINRFTFFIHRHLIAYFASKIINPFRKCNLYFDIKTKLNSPLTHKKKTTYLELSLQILEKPQDIDNLIKGHTLKNLSSAAKLVGYLLGENLYENILGTNKPVYNKLKETLFKASYSKEEFLHLMQSIFFEKMDTALKKRTF